MNPPKKVLATWNTKNIAFHIDEDMKLTKLHDEIKSSFGIKKEIDLFIFDEDFEEYVLLLNMSHIKHMHKILVKLRDDDSELQPPKTVRSNSDHSNNNKLIMLFFNKT
ncbi:hypothetical protein Avbf_16198 [Armadillidium vulgare]|nr:hypothetical protein Avbf_16198 [Armadillidium vulgare]